MISMIRGPALDACRRPYCPLPHTHTHTPHTTASTDDAPDPHLCLDGLLNATVFRHDGVYAFGRVRERGPLAVCAIEPTVAPWRNRAAGRLSFEDPRYLGVHDDVWLLFAPTVWSTHKYGDHSIYQAALHMTATWTLRDFGGSMARASVATRRTGCPSARSRPTVPALSCTAPKPASPHGRPRRADGGVGSR